VRSRRVWPAVALIFASVLAGNCGRTAPYVPPSTGASPSIGPSLPLQPVQQNQSPDLDGPANTVVFSARIDSPTDGDIYIVGIDGRNLRRLTSSSANEYSASWSPDGRRLAFMSLGFPAGSSSNDYDIYVVDADGRNVQRLTRTPGEDGWPAWSHHGTRIAYTRRTDERASDEIHVIAADGEDDRALTDDTDGLDYGYPSWSPNDLFLAFSAYPQTEPATASGGMFVMRPDGSGRLLIMADGVGPVWQPATPFEAQVLTPPAIRPAASDLAARGVLRMIRR